MAKSLEVVLRDDLDGSIATQTVRFALDDTTYEIDLNAENAAELRRDLARWIKVARVEGAPKPRREKNRNPKALGVPFAEVRQWARENGIEVSDTGRISVRVLKAYDDAHP
ncbi:histone-like nucleoid-structuring protein Lsr2 [Tsukamurella soli]|uniref:Lsr2 family protein n=1 Tax=Tsukamurella soli TaxID=644556 RepID=A0ABP8K2A4_9ACTN